MLLKYFKMYLQKKTIKGLHLVYTLPKIHQKAFLPFHDKEACGTTYMKNCVLISDSIKTQMLSISKYRNIIN